MNCALCDTPITEQNNTKEHLIPNSIGGKKTVTGFICDPCNNTSGMSWDSELAKQLNWLSLMFSINRQRGNVPSQVFETIEKGGKRGKIRINHDGSEQRPNSEFREESINGIPHLSISANSEKEFKQILKGYKRKYPQLDIDECLKNAKFETCYPNHIIVNENSFGGEKTGRSIVKSALALAVMSEVEAKTCNNALDYLKNSNAEPCFGFYYERDLIQNRPDGIIFHCVAVYGNPQTKQLLGYVEFYGCWRMVVCLSDNYKGKEFNSCYAIDPVSRLELNLEVALLLTPEEILAIYRYEKMPEDRQQAAFDTTMQIGIKNIRERQQKEAMSEASGAIGLPYFAA
jgi:hypothetical protein